MQVDSMENLSNLELNNQLSSLAELLNPIKKKSSLGVILSDNLILNFCESWSILMPLSLKYGAYVEPLAWERSKKKYRAKYLALDENGRMARYGTKYMSDDNDPARALVMTLLTSSRH